jgi:transketolase
MNSIALRDAYGAAIVEFGEKYENLVVLDADLATSTRTAAYRMRFPDRYLNVGIAEQNMVGMAAGIALGGGMPAVNTFAAFLTRRAADQIAISVAYPRLNVKLFGFHAGIGLGEDGATQQAVEDLGIMQAIPNIRVYAPVDAGDLRAVLAEVFEIDGPTYVRLARPATPQVVDEPGQLAPGYRVLRNGNGNVVVVTTGTTTAEVLAAVDALQREGPRMSVLAVTRLKPLDDSIATTLAGKRIAVVEEHNVHGGLADALSAVLDAHNLSHRLERIGIQDMFGESGRPVELLASHGLAGDPLSERLRRWSQG